MTTLARRAAFVLLLGIGCAGHGVLLRLEDAVVVSPSTLNRQESKALAMLLDEVQRRTEIRWLRTNGLPSGQTPLILAGTSAELAVFAKIQLPQIPDSARRPEGYRLCVSQNDKRLLISVIGHDSRGVLFGIGRLLRELRLERGRIELPTKLDIATAPRYPLRGHQLGYRPKCNSYDAWDVPVWEQYFRDLAVFGCNAIELIPPRSDDAATSPHFPKPPMQMITEMSRLADDYGLDVWIWYPAMDPDYSNPKTVDFALREWAEVFRKLPRVDAVFVPGGDPGHTRPRFLLPLLERQATNLHAFHPRAQMWMSPQSFNQQWLDEFLDMVSAQRPAWLNGVVFGPQVRIPLPDLRRRLPAQYPIRHYPDITHSRQCQFPVPDWDVAYAVTEARECINPRPLGEAAIFQKLQPDTIGFITYSEGCNDDVNKIIWSGLGWDPAARVTDILREYSRYFIGERHATAFGEGLLALERNWQGSLLTNRGVEKTLTRFQRLEKEASPQELANWRFQQALFRAYYDAYTRRRLIYETSLEKQALEQLRKTLAASSPVPALAAAEAILDRGNENHVAASWRAHIIELGDALFNSIRMQLSVKRHKAIAVDRGASLDTLDFPLNNAPWLKQRFAHIRKLSSPADQSRILDEIMNWSDPGPGGFYDDLGNSSRQPHLVRGFPFSEDPGCLKSARVDFEEDLVVDEPDDKPPGPRRVSWMDHAEALYDTPLRMRYTHLDSRAQYRLRVLYAGDNFRRKIRLAANETIEIHPFISKPLPIKRLEFPIPSAAIVQGELNLSWYGEPGLGGNGRNAQVSEVWLIKSAAPLHN